MKFLLDESAEFRLLSFLRLAGHDVTAIARDYPQALSDPVVLAIARSEGRILITNDTDFGELVFRRRLPHAGVILFRLRPESTVEDKISCLERLLLSGEQTEGQFIVVSRTRHRVRSSAGSQPPQN
jgi:predicted nuclease of predicted toxin-antitoxin system